MRLFGTDGIREVGKYPLNTENVLKLAKASSCFKKNSNSRVVINKDTRLSDIFLNQLNIRFYIHGIEVILVGPLPTPALTV